MKKIFLLFLSTTVMLEGVSRFLFPNINKGDTKMYTYSIPHEKTEHEGTWLIWPHQYTYGVKYRQEIEPIWIKISQSLSSGEKVHIIAHNEKEKNVLCKCCRKNRLTWKILIL